MWRGGNSDSDGNGNVLSFVHLSSDWVTRFTERIVRTKPRGWINKEQEDMEDAGYGSYSIHTFQMENWEMSVRAARNALARCVLVARALFKMVSCNLIGLVFYVKECDCKRVNECVSA